jgi:fibronectin type III domain protein
MVLTTLLLRLQKTIGCTPRESLVFNSLVLGLMVLCLPLIAGCGTEGDAVNGTGLADPGNGNGHGYGLNRGAEVSLSPSGLAFSATLGSSSPAPQIVTVSNSGTGTLDWSVSTTAGWLSISPTSETAPSSFIVTPTIAGLAAGTYSTTIVVSANGPANTTQSIPVDLTISTTTSTSTSTPTPPAAPSTGSVFLSWSPVQDSSVTGYYVHFGLQSPNSAGSCTYTQSTFYSLASLTNKSSPLVTVSGLTANTTYYFAVSAYNGRESACSNEVSTFTQTI